MRGVLLNGVVVYWLCTFFQIVLVGILECTGTVPKNNIFLTTF